MIPSTQLSQPTMTPPNTVVAEPGRGYSLPATTTIEAARAPASAVSWGAILAGAAAAAALSLILLILGTGLGLSAVSPWAEDGITAATFGVSTILWLTFTQLFASGLGGYLAGRLRTKWFALPGDEAYFRDTAHGFLAWAVASLATAALLGSAIGAIVGGGVQAGAAMTGGVAAVGADAAKAAAGPMGYHIDSLFRSDANTAAAEPPAAAATAEVSRIFSNTARGGALPAEDARYIGQLVAQRTGLSPQEAEKRVGDTYTRMQTALLEAETTARDAADKGRKASAYAALWLFVSLLGGAFVASLAATFGGRQRDR